MLFRLLPVFLMVAAVGARESPATIRLAPAAHVAVDNGRLLCSITITNNGTESARRLRLTAEFKGVRHTLPQTQARIEPGGSLAVAYHLDQSPIPAAGEYPFILRIHYQDNSGYPFAAVYATVVSFAMPEEHEKPVGIRLYPPDALKDHGEIRVIAVSRHSHKLRARVRLAVPDHLDSHDHEYEIELPAGTARGASFPLVNRTGRAGSRLAVWAVATYEVNGLTRCTIKPVTVTIPPHRGRMAHFPLFWTVSAVILLLWFAAMQWPAVANRITVPRLKIEYEWLFLWVLLLFLVSAHVPPALLLRDTLTVGGDTPAHNFLASHLSTQWQTEHRILTWSHDWWSGFPVFQFYFPLPYVLIAMLSTVIPFNIAFKLICVLGIIMLPGTVYLAGRMLKFPRPVPSLMTVMVLPFLFTDAHVMWGVNLYSTLAGMIANSFSFALFPLCLACAWRDADDGRPRMRTSLLLAALILSHFFTSLIAALTIVVFPLLKPGKGRRRALQALLVDGGLALLLTAWWLIPLFAKREYSVAFGQDWDVSLPGSMPAASFLALAPALAAIAFAFRARGGAIWIWIWMTGIATALFAAGTALHPVFVNIRLWPFIYFGFLSLAAVGGGMLLQRSRCPGIAVLAILLLMAVRIDNPPSRVRYWAEWNFEGLEAKPLADTFRRLIEPLDKTPGRLAHDLHDYNNAFGSSRIFEAVPHLIDKPIIMGGLVNSALGSLFTYTVQGQISEQGAGYPSIVPPSQFAPATGLLHLELFNVRHVIAAWEQLQEFLSTASGWNLLYTVDDYKVFEAAGRDPGMIGVLDDHPPAVVVSDRQRAAVDWMQTPALLDHPFIWLQPGKTPPPQSAVVNEAEYRDLVAKAAAAATGTFNLFPFDDTQVNVTEWSHHRIRFRTDAVGRPHLIKVAFFPNWRVSGAPAVFMASPAFMLIVPEREDIELTYGHTVSDRIGHIAAMFGLAALAAWGVRRFSTGRPCQ